MFCVITSYLNFLKQNVRLTEQNNFNIYFFFRKKRIGGGKRLDKHVELLYCEVRIQM